MKKSQYRYHLKWLALLAADCIPAVDESHADANVMPCCIVANPADAPNPRRLKMKAACYT
jgi:hypothetical protein